MIRMDLAGNVAADKGKGVGKRSPPSFNLPGDLQGLHGPQGSNIHFQSVKLRIIRCRSTVVIVQKSKSGSKSGSRSGSRSGSKVSVVNSQCQRSRVMGHGSWSFNWRNPWGLLGSGPFNLNRQYLCEVRSPLLAFQFEKTHTHR
jgi:hypothetical protein